MFVIISTQILDTVFNNDALFTQRLSWAFKNKTALLAQYTFTGDYFLI